MANYCIMTVIELHKNDNEILQDDFGSLIDRYQQEHCDHEWHCVGSVSGSKSQYTIHVCSKCGEQQTQKAIKDKDGNCKISTIIGDN